MKPLHLCIAMGVLNEEKRLPACLNNLMEQDFPKDRLRILIADGGSTDKTWQIADAYGAEVYENPYVTGDMGIRILAGKCREDLFLPWAADNAFPRKDWLRRMVAVYESISDLSFFWGTIRAGQTDPPINKYYALIQSDPLTWFLNRNLDHYLQITPPTDFNGVKGYLFRIDENRPLVAGANGCVFRFSHCSDLFQSSSKIIENDIFQSMVERGRNKIAYLPEMGVFHHSIPSLRNWMSKWQRNYKNHFLKSYKGRNLNWIYDGGGSKLKMFIWMVYALIPIFSSLDAGWRMIRDRSIYWCYHPLAAFLQTVTYTWITMGTKTGRTYMKEFLLNQFRDASEANEYESPAH